MEIKAFLDALGGDMVALLSGIGSVVLLILGITVFHKKELPRWIVLVVAAVCFFLASARVWTTEHRAYLRTEKSLKELTTPKLGCKITTMVSAKLKRGDKNSFLVVGGTITNQGAPTVLDLWRVAIRFHDGSILRAEPMVPLGPGGRLSITGGALGLEPEDGWAHKAACDPIETGGAAAGWLYFVIRNLPTDEFWDHHPTAVILNVTDVNGKEWSFEQAIDGQDSPPVSPGEFIEVDKDGSHSSENGRI